MKDALVYLLFVIVEQVEEEEDVELLCDLPMIHFHQRREKLLIEYS